MRSGNGRHRRPRQAPALFVAAGVTGAGIAIPLLGATGAQAADAGTWDRVAECESGGVWSANESNGYYGGLQLTLEMWEQYGGTAYAERPDLASRSQQIAVGEKVLAEKGPEAFPRCAASAGLTDSAEDPGVDPGALPGPTEDDPTPSPSDGTDGTDGADDTGSGSGGTGNIADPSPTSPSDDSSRTPSDDASGPSTPDEDHGSHPSDPTPAPDDSGNSDGSDGSGNSGEPGYGSGTGSSHDGRGDGDGGTGHGRGEGSGKHRGSPDEREDAGHPSRDDGREGLGKHRVRSGDSLSEIAERQHLHGGWPSLYERNKDVIGDDPDLILPGQELRY
ncbi:LysM peptidoglycan-binding domain-containing protein [Streptomyces cacaoi]|uniref:Peptidoglycan-binding protein LysM n=1 Tax=Streptomyces cacaoi TaxID=1898 RepID=A0A4Y3QWL3_STRCI|nr:transglycosylase family protein [Streptomyces cacaoi]NNG88050.1 LysM peptidoglycan-binding domain-containing protein [Streptomyces cacaoi]GEB49359.1 peptidoglycan-binding protein LysM [Streptomyces cacaoi]